jgi:hypothetical protein
VPGTCEAPRFVSWSLRTNLKEIQMPLILWLLGVPLSIVLLLMLFGVF